MSLLEYHDLLVLGSRLLLITLRALKSGPLFPFPLPPTDAEIPVLRNKFPFEFPFPFPFPLLPPRARSRGSRDTSPLVSGLGGGP